MNTEIRYSRFESKKIVIGITGTLASGKTTVADMFVEEGAFKIDADEIGHMLLRDDEDIKKQVIDILGQDVLSGGRIDRQVIRSKVFWDKGKLKELNDILHPAIIDVIEKQIEKCDKDMVIVDAPLLIETKLNEKVDVVAVVVTERDIAMERAVKRGLTRETIDRIRGSQLPADEKLKYADHIIDNNGDIKKTKEGVKELCKKIQDL